MDELVRLQRENNRLKRGERNPKNTDIHQRRWRPSTIVRLEWACGARTIEIVHIYGLMAQLQPDRSGVALLRASVPQCRFAPALELIEPDGATRATLESSIRIDR